MFKTLSHLLPIVLLSTLLLAVTPVAGMPPAGGEDQPAHGPALQAPVVEDLLLTLVIPKDSPFLAGQDLGEVILPKALGPRGTLSLQVPVISEKFVFLPLAMIDNEPLTLGDFRTALDPELDEQGAIVATVAGQDPAQLFKRQVDSRVIIREAREIGLDQLPVVANLVDVFSRQQLRVQLVKQKLAGIKADPVVVERLFNEAARESRLKAMLFSSEDDAKDFYNQLFQEGIYYFSRMWKEAESFDDLAARFVTAGRGEKKGGAEGEFVFHKEMQPELVKAIEALAPGQATPVLAQGKQFTVIQFLEARVVENQDIRQDAERRAKNFAGNTALADMNNKLLEKYVKLDKSLYESLDFSNDLETLLQDKRVLAEIKGGKPYLVSDLAEGLKGKYYHGVKRAIEGGKVKTDRHKILFENLNKRAWFLECIEQGIDQTPEFKRLLDNYEGSVIFGVFMQQAVDAKIQFTMDDLHAYYIENIKDYITPEKIGLRGLVFRDKTQAQSALDYLQRGTDFKWLQSTVEGLVPLDPVTVGLLDLGDGKLFTSEDLPADLIAALDGVATGEYRLYDDGKEFFYVLMAERIIPPTGESFEEAQNKVAEKFFKQRREEVLDEMVKKLRKAYEVEVYVQGFNKSKM